MNLDAINTAFRRHLASQLGGTWSGAGAMYGEYRLRAQDGPELYLEADVDAELGSPCVRLLDIEALQPGTSIGTRALSAVREFCDEHALPLVIEKARSSWWDRPEHDWLSLAGYDFFVEPWLVYRQPDWPALSLDLDAERGASARAAGVALDLD
jgi:hypothetical protein